MKTVCPLCDGVGKIKNEEFEINQYGQKRIIIAKRAVKVGDFYLIARVLKTSKDGFKQYSWANKKQFTTLMPRAKFYRNVCNTCQKAFKEVKHGGNENGKNIL